MSAVSPGGASPAKGGAVKQPRGSNAGANKSKAVQESPQVDRCNSSSPETSPQHLDWEKAEDEAEKRRLEAERVKREELEEIRRAEAEIRKARDRERMAQEEERRREAMDKQKMLDSLEKPMVEMLQRLGYYEKLGMLLAQNQILTLKGLLEVPRSQFPQILTSKQQQAEAFKNYDADGSGAIDAQELKLALVDLGIDVSATETEAILKKYVDGDEDELDLKSFSRLINDLGTTDLAALDRVVVAARRSVALDHITNLQLPEDAAWEATAAAKSMEEKAAKALQMRKSEQGYGVYGGKKAGGGANKEAEDAGPLSMAEQIAKRWEVVEDNRPPAGPLRNELLTVVNRWYDYLATVPSLGEFLARSTTGFEALRKKKRPGVEDVDDKDEDDEEDEAKAKAKREETANRMAQVNALTRRAESSRKEYFSGDAGTYGPTWKHTVSWALWMLTVKSHRTSRKLIEKHLKLAQEHVWRALYPGLELLSCAEWRIYWQRVKSNFDGFFCNRGIDNWKQVAAADARAQAIREGKSSAEQDAAASKAERLVSSMLHPVSRRRAPQQQQPPPPQPQQPQQQQQRQQQQQQRQLRPTVDRPTSSYSARAFSPTLNFSQGKLPVPLPKRLTASRAAMIEHRRQEVAAAVPAEVAVVIAEVYEQEPTDSPTRFARYDASPIKFATTQSRYMDALSRPASHPGGLQSTQLPFGDRSPRPLPVPQLQSPSSSRRRLSKTPRSAPLLLERSRSSSSLLERSRSGSSSSLFERSRSGSSSSLLERSRSGSSSSGQRSHRSRSARRG